MITQFGSRVFTEDIDVLVHLDKQSGEYRKLKNAIRFIAHDVRESQKWLTDNIGDFMEEVGKIPEGKLWLKHGMLEVYVPEPQYILALKVLAARDKDMNDIQILLQRLRLKKRRQVETILRKYVKKDILEDEWYARRIEQVLTEFFG